MTLKNLIDKVFQEGGSVDNEIMIGCDECSSCNKTNVEDVTLYETEIFNCILINTSLTNHKQNGGE